MISTLQQSPLPHQGTSINSARDSPPDTYQEYRFANQFASSAYDQDAVDSLHHHNVAGGTFTLPKRQNNKKISLRSLPSQSKLKLQKPLNQLIPRFDIKIISLCLVWYLTSILSSNSTKLILRQFKHPIILTELQFVLTQFFCIIAVMLLKLDRNDKFKQNFPNGTFPQYTHRSIRTLITPTKNCILTTLPMGGFQFIGHITSHKATSVIPVSLVHTIKLLSPITTVLIYRFFYKKKFDSKTYITLIPLVVGVMCSCVKNPNSKTSLSNANYEKGCFFAFCSMIIFVSQNIFAKKIFTASTMRKRPTLLPHAEEAPHQDENLDKLTILYWCSTVGFVLTLPILVISEFAGESSILSIGQISFGVGQLLVLNGLSHFIQSLMLFQILGIISTVNYSIVNILKRICVIMAAILYERQSINGIQSVGLVLTFVGLYSYDRWGKSRTA